MAEREKTRRATDEFLPLKPLILIEVGAGYRASFKSKWEHTTSGEVGDSLLTLLYSITYNL